MLLLDIAVRGSIVLAVGLLLCVALRKRAPALRHAVLAATLCVTPIIVPIGTLLPAVELDLPRASRPSPSAPLLQARPAASAALAEAPSANDVAVGVETSPLVATVTVRSIRWPAFALGIWAIGTVAFLASLFLSMARLARATRRATPIDNDRWNAALAAAMRVAGLRRAVSLRASPRSDLLATWGWRQPCLLVPADALGWPRERIDIVLGHELAHVRRVDWAWQIQAAVVRAFFWWNPLVWLASHQLSVESERACDDAVLALGVAPHTYAEQLVAVARALRVSSSLPAIAVSMARPSTLHRRITAMLNPHLQRTTPGRVTTALLIGGLLALLVPVAAIRGAVAQAPLEGVVYDPTGAVVPEVKLVLAGAGGKAEATTDAEGRFVFAGVEPGKYVLEGLIPGFRAVREEVELRQPADWTRVVTLPVGDLRETISVKARRGSGATAPAAGPVPVRVGGNIRPPRKLKDVKPIYPESMREAGREGTVSIDAVIGLDGSVVAARVRSADVYPELGTAAIDAVRQWKFSPTLLNGKPIEVVMAVSVSFSLE